MQEHGGELAVSATEVHLKLSPSDGAIAARCGAELWLQALSFSHGQGDPLVPPAQ